MDWLDDLEEPLQSQLRALAEKGGSRLSGPLFDFQDTMAAINLMETAIQNHAQAKRDEEASRAIDPEPRERTLRQLLMQHKGGDLWTTDVVFPAILRRSLLVAICSQVEGELKLRCNAFEKNEQLMSQEA